jgi:hypothetical protein
MGTGETPNKSLYLLKNSIYYEVWANCSLTFTERSLAEFFIGEFICHNC